MDSRAMHLCVLLLALTGCGADAAQNMEPGLAFGRIYVATHDDLIVGRTYSYLMFYADGIVIGAASKDTPTEMASWFNRDNAVVGRGVFELERGRLSFSLKIQTGLLKHAGVVDRDRLVLKVVSLVDRQTREYVYHLVRAEQAAAGDARDAPPELRRWAPRRDLQVVRGIPEAASCEEP
jgi:hypothetical protein